MRLYYLKPFVCHLFSTVGPEKTPLSWLAFGFRMPHKEYVLNFTLFFWHLHTVLSAAVPPTEIVGKSDYFRFGMRDSLAIEASFLQVN